MSHVNLSALENTSIMLRLQKVTLTGASRTSPIMEKIAGFQFVQDYSLDPEEKLSGFGRERQFRDQIDETVVVARYEPQFPDLPCRFTIKSDALFGVRPGLAASLLAEITDHRLTSAQFAFTFPERYGVDSRFIRQFGMFGEKCRGRIGHGEALLYGSPTSLSQVRCYEDNLDPHFHVELQLNSELLDQYDVRKIQDFPRLVHQLSPGQVKFVDVSKRLLREHLVNKFGERGNVLAEEAFKLSKVALYRVRQHLTHIGVPDLNRFLRPLEINNEISRVTERWIDEFSEQFE